MLPHARHASVLVKRHLNGSCRDWAKLTTNAGGNIVLHGDGKGVVSLALVAPVVVRHVWGISPRRWCSLVAQNYQT